MEAGQLNSQSLPFISVLFLERMHTGRAAGGLVVGR